MTLQPSAPGLLVLQVHLTHYLRTSTTVHWIAGQIGALFAAFSSERSVHQQLTQLHENLIVRRSHLDKLAETFILQLRASAEPVLPSSFELA